MTLSKVIKKYAVVIGEPFTITVTGDPEPEYEGPGEPDAGLHDEGQEPDAGPETGAPPIEYKPADILSERETEIDRETIKKEAAAQARAQAQRAADLIINHTLDNARAELGEVLQQGYSDGFEAGKNEAVSVIAPALEKISLLAESITQAQDKMLEDFRDEMFNIIAEISRKVLRKEIDEKDEYLIALFEDALKDVKAEEFITVTVSESQAEFMLRNIDIFKAYASNIEEFKIIPDKNAERGTMIVETAKTVADASFEVQMEEIEVILDRMKEKLSAQVLDDFEFDDDDYLYGDDDAV